MLVLAHQRCFNHARREAAARCPSCGRYFCRECVSEHEGRLLCVGCLGAQVQHRSAGRRLLAPIRRGACAAMGVLLLWAVFFACGKALLAIPSEFHEQRGVPIESQDGP